MRHDPSAFEVPPALWDRPETVQALQGRDVGRLFRLLRQYAGASQTGLMMRTGIAKSEVSTIMNGRSVTTLARLEAIADGLGMPGRARVRLGLAPQTRAEVPAAAVPAGAAVRLATAPGGAGVPGPDAGAAPVTREDPPPARPPFMEFWHSGPRPPGSVASQEWYATPGSTVEAGLLSHLETLTGTYREVDYALGAAAVHQEAALHVRRLLDLADQVPSRLYRRFLRCLADAAQLAAWLCIDGQEYTAARQYCALALSAAEEAGDPCLHAYVLGQMSYAHLHAGRGDEALRLLEGAAALFAAGGVHAAVRSWVFEATGEAHGLRGNSTAGARVLHQAESLFDAVGPDDAPDYLGFYNAPCHAARLRGRCLVKLGEARPAAEALREALDLLPGHFVRERSGTLIDLAAAQLDGGHPDDAAAQALAATELAVATRSRRNLARIRELAPRFAPFTTLPAVQQLLHQPALTA